MCDKMSMNFSGALSAIPLQLRR